MTTLLDANVLFALGWSHHTHHRAANIWFDSRSAEPWATCLITQSAFLRLSLNQHAMNAEVSVADAMAVLRSLVAHPSHVYLGQETPLTDGSFGILAGRLTGYRQVTDATLLHIAAHHGASLATFDRAIEQLSLERGNVKILPTK